MSANAVTAWDLREEPVARARWMGPPRTLLRFMRRKPLGFFGLVLVVVFIVMAVFAPVVAPYRYDEQQLRHRLEAPSSEHLLGTDSVGRDVFSRLVFGARASISVGFGAVAITGALAATIGIVSGYYGGKMDLVIQRIVEIWQAMPGLIVLITILGVFGTGLVPMILAIGILGAGSGSRVYRGAVMSLRENTYILAARATGAGDLRILLVYILPNVVPLMLVLASVGLGGVILAESTLSFLGFGLPPPFPSWGQMLSVEGRDYMRTAPGLAVFPGLAIGLAVFGFNMLGDALRDVLDPRLRGTSGRVG
jgi:peptide/nickel transport system permease protein